MKILVLGASGMLGHQLWLYLGNYFEVHGTLRRPCPKLVPFEHSKRKLIQDISIEKPESLWELLRKEKYQYVINCVGIIKQLDAVKNPVNTINVNSLFPHLLASSSEGAKIIQISTDCVFSGNKGAYSEEDVPDATDLYGRSKLLGELDYSPHLTLRTSIVGHEILSQISLLDWFLSQKNEIKGFTHAVYSGLTTLELSKKIYWILDDFPNLSGLWQISSEPIDKYSLLRLVSRIYGKNVQVTPFDEFKTDKSLSYQKLNQYCGYVPTSWEYMIQDLYDQYQQYYKSLYAKN